MGWFLFLSLCFLLFHFPSYTSSSVPLCNHDEASALLHFKNSFSLDCYRESCYPKTKSWKNGTNCCLWNGVSCDTESSHVIGLHLSCSCLQGKLHPNSTLFQLTHLQTLNLAVNDFSGSQIFSGFGNLVALTHLNLSDSGFDGVISSKISHLSKLVSLDLSYPYIGCNLSSGYRSCLSTPQVMNPHLRFEPSTFEKLIVNVTGLRELALDGLDMSLIKPNSLSLLVNFSSSLVSLSLPYTGLQGKLANNMLRLPNLQKLDLSYNEDLEGPILQFLSNLTQLEYLDLGWNKFSGEIPLSLGNITQLTSLDLSLNNFSGEIPDLFGKLSKLQVLYLSHNNLVGQLPSSLFGLTQLHWLRCSDNKLVGPIPDKISGLSNLTHLDLSNNLLNGTIPHWCYSLSSLSTLYLSRNQLTGPIGEFSAYSLEGCDLSYNRLQGNIPNSMFNLQNLSYLSLSSNNLSGLVDFRKISKLQYLNTLDLSHNNFLSFSSINEGDYTFPNLQRLVLSSCNINSFPRFLSQLKNLDYLDLSKNQIHGRIPNWFMRNGSLNYLDLSHNLLTSIGYLSFSWGNMQYIDLSFNKLEGDIPIPLFGTRFFSVSNNKLTGDISSAICNVSSLEILNLSHNNLTGKLPQCLGTLPDLSVLDLQRNNLFGIIPRTYFGKKVLETMNLNGNQLKGPLPQSMAKSKSLKVLDLGENNIEDSFPSWLESLQELQVLVLRANRFNGTITCSKAKHTFPKLRIFDVSNNNFSGTLPTACIKNSKGMMMNVDNDLQYMSANKTDYPQRYNDSVMVTIKGNNIELERILTTFTTIDLSNNKFEGKIPTIIGELKSLKGLNLSHNRITGFIPRSFGGLENLEWLDLSSNKLTGEIPEVLTNLYFLSFLNLSQNQLEGIIPSGHQFNTFKNDSYQGNPRLCGLPLSKSCHKDEEQPTNSTSFQHKEEFGFGWKPVAIGYASGMVFGILLGSIVFLIGRPQWLIKLVEDIANQGMRKTSYRFGTKRRGKN